MMNSIGTSDTIAAQGDNVGTSETKSMTKKRKISDDKDFEQCLSKYLKTEEITETANPETLTDIVTQGCTEVQTINFTPEDDDLIGETNDRKTPIETLISNDQSKASVDPLSSCDTNTIDSPFSCDTNKIKVLVESPSSCETITIYASVESTSSCDTNTIKASVESTSSCDTSTIKASGNSTASCDTNTIKALGNSTFSCFTNTSTLISKRDDEAETSYEKDLSLNESDSLTEKEKIENSQSNTSPEPRSPEKPKRPEAASLPKLYRLLGEHENISRGLRAKNPYANVQVAVHVARGSNGQSSQYISTCSSSWDAQCLRGLKSRSKFKRGTKHIVEIDVASLPEEVRIIDLRDEDTRKQHETGNSSIDADFHRYARQFSEVLLVGEIPQSCLKLM